MSELKMKSKIKVLSIKKCSPMTVKLPFLKKKNAHELLATFISNPRKILQNFSIFKCISFPFRMSQSSSV